MRRHVVKLNWVMFIGLIMIGLVTPVDAAQWTFDQTGSRMSFKLSSTLHDVEGQVEQFQGSIDGARGRAELAISSMTTQNRMRDKKMYQMFESSVYPAIIYEFELPADVSQLKSDEEVAIQGTLIMHGVSYDYPITARVERASDGIHLIGQRTVLLSDFQLKPPGVLGVIKVADEVEVQFDVFVSA